MRHLIYIRLHSFESFPAAQLEERSFGGVGYSWTAESNRSSDRQVERGKGNKARAPSLGGVDSDSETDKRLSSKAEDRNHECECKA